MSNKWSVVRNAVEEGVFRSEQFVYPIIKVSIKFKSISKKINYWN